MQPQTRELLDHFPVRKSQTQKAAFRQWLTGVLRDAGYDTVVEESGGLIQNANVVAGNPDRAKVLFTAHYDTPARLLWPNLIAPRSLLLTLLLQLPEILLLLVLVVVPEVVIIRLTDNALPGLLTGWAILIAVLILMMAGPANSSNVNDNTSGVATLLETALTLPPEEREEVAFVFFDNEEKGMVGSGRFRKEHQGNFLHTLLVNFDCVSDGMDVMFFPNKGVKKRSDLFALLEDSFPPREGRAVTVVRRGGFYPSDQLGFPLGVGVAALHRGPLGPWLGRIHTPRDTVFQEENIELLRQGSHALIAALPVESKSNL